MNRMEKALKSSKFELLDWMDILESYFGQKIIWKQEVLQRMKNKGIFNKILKEIKFDIVKEWLYNRIKEKSTIYQRLQKEYKDHPAQLKVLLKHIEHGITKLPVFCTKREACCICSTSYRRSSFL